MVEPIQPTDLGAVILAGGTGRRMGGADKAALELDGKALLDHVLDGVPADVEIAVVGPPRPTSRVVTWCREEPAGGGPLSGLAAGLANVESSLVLLLSCDAPLVGSVLPNLIEAAERAVAVGRDGAGTRLSNGSVPPIPVCGSRTAFMRVLPESLHNGRLWPIIDALDLDRIPVAEDLVRDVDTPQDLEHVRQTFIQGRESS